MFDRNGTRISDKIVAQLLRDHGYPPDKSVEGAASVPERAIRAHHSNPSTGVVHLASDPSPVLPFFSPDGKAVGFSTSTHIALYPSTGGPVAIIDPATSTILPGAVFTWSWSPDSEFIAFSGQHIAGNNTYLGLVRTHGTALSSIVYPPSNTVSGITTWFQP